MREGVVARSPASARQPARMAAPPTQECRAGGSPSSPACTENAKTSSQVRSADTRLGDTCGTLQLITKSE